MPLDTSTYDIEDTIAELRERQDELADTIANSDDVTPLVEDAQQEGQQIDRYIAGLEWLRDEFDAETLTLGALTNGERHRVQETAGASNAARQNAYVAMGTVDGPYIEHGGSINQGDFEASTANVADLHPGYVDWAEQEITEMSRLGGSEGNGFRDLVRAKQNRES